jgi:hypothetical protein
MLIPDNGSVGQIESIEEKVHLKYDPPTVPVDVPCTYCGKRHIYKPEEFRLFGSPHPLIPPEDNPV